VYSNGNLAFTSNSASASWQSGLSTIGVSSGKWYFEATATAITGANLVFAGAAKETFTAYNSYLGSSADSWGVQYGNGDSPPSIFKYNSNSGTSITAGSIVAGNIIQVAVDVDNGHIWFGKNNTWAEGDPTAGTGASFTNLSGTIMLGVSSNTTGNKLTANFGQQPFWKAGGTGVSNTAGSRTSTVSVNQDAGFSIVSWTANAADPSTVGHGLVDSNGLGVAPDVIIMKARTGVTDNWRYGGSNLPSWSYSMALNVNAGETAGPDVFNQTAPTSTVFTVGGDVSVNTDDATMIAYCFAEIEGYSKFGKYTGNASTNGPFVYTGFRPAWVLVKRTNPASPNNWILWDTTRNTYNQIDDNLYPDSDADENNDPGIDALSNGFKIRGTALFSNASGGSYIYMAFAENPFKYANAR
jgi:hypothetical protein